jgi:hypothetical protein
MSGLPKIDAVAFWLEGVLAPSLADLCAQVFFDQPIASVDVHIRLRLRTAGEQLALGQIDAAAFCARAVESCGAVMTPAECEQALRGALVLRNEVRAIVQDLPTSAARWVLCGMPRSWVDTSALAPIVTPERWLFTSEMHLLRLTPDVFATWATRAGLPLSACMMVDAETPRAVEAVRRGLHAAIYVDAKRLRREFVLRRMLPPPPGFVYPGPAELEKDATP